MLDIENQKSFSSSGGNLPSFFSRNQRIIIPVFIALTLLALGFTFIVMFTTNTSQTRGVATTTQDASVLIEHSKRSAAHMAQQSARTDFPILLVADRDKASKTTTEDKGTVWKSVLLRGSLKRNPTTGEYSVSYDDKPWEISGLLVEGSRGMELSELKMFDGKLYAADDRTGIVYQLLISQSNGQTKVRAVARHILSDGDGYSTSKGFKCEWVTVKDNKLYVGSIGKEWTNGKGEILSQDPMYVKTIDANGRVEHLNWVNNFKAMQRAVGIKGEGYMVHEAGEWSDYHKRWFFLPRRVSFEKYDEKEDERRGSNYVISASEDFSDVSSVRIGDIISPTRGFSSVKFIPGRPNEVVAIKSEETDEAIRSFIMVFDISTGKVLLPETLIMAEKIEGLEIA